MSVFDKNRTKMENRRKNFSNKRQLEYLIELMEKHRYIAKGVCKRSEATEFWKKFTTELNELGPPSKTSEKWMKVWVDLKAKTKKKLVENNKEFNKDEDGPNQFIILTPSEERISDILHTNLLVDPPGREFGEDLPNDTSQVDMKLENQEIKMEIFEDETLDNESNFQNISTVQQSVLSTPNQKFTVQQSLPSTSNQTHSTSQSRLTDSERKKIFEEHSTDFKNVVQNLEELNENVKGILEYQKKKFYLMKDTNSSLIKIKKEKLLIYKNEIEQKQKDRALMLEIKMELLELRKQQGAQN